MNSPFFLLAVSLATLANTAKASTISTFDVLVATSSVSIGTSAPTAQLEAWRPQNGAHFAWFASSGAFRVGKAAGSQWNSGNLGSFSTAFGSDNTASAAGSAIGGGSGHLAAGDFSSISGGFANETDDDDSSVSGGADNAATFEGAAVAGGSQNLASGQFSTVGGGNSNFATGVEATVPGGVGNTASGQYSFAAGALASAEGVGSFVWADSQFVTLRSLIQNEFKARAGGGFVLLGVAGSPTVIVSSGPVMISTSATAASAMPSIYVAATGGEVGMGTKNPATTLDVNGSAQFGSGATKSTFTSTGLLKVTSSGIQWADGSTSTTGAAGASAVYLTTFTTNIPSATNNNTTFGAAVAGSSITLTGTTHSNIRCYFNGACDLTTTGAYVMATMMVDGGFAPGYSNTKAMMVSYMGDASGAARNCSFTFLFTGLSSGNHTFAMAFRSNGGSWLLEDPSGTWGNQFSCSEVP